MNKTTLPSLPHLPLNDPAAAYTVLHDYGQQCAATIKADWLEADRQSTNEWRKLALQFDSHRMQAIGHLKAIVDHLPVDMQPHIRNFLSAPPDRQARGEPTKCVGCEGSPSSENNPCGVCGKGVPVGWEFNLNGDWIRTTEPETHEKMGREVRPLYTAPQAQKIPDGYALVPIEPTEEMLFACQDAGSISNHQRGKRIYKAMLEAAPEVKP